MPNRHSGGEPIFRNGQVCGYLTSVAFGHTVGKAVGMGYVRKATGGPGHGGDRWVTPDWIKEGHYEIEIATKRVKAEAQLQPPYDPKNERIKS